MDILILIVAFALTITIHEMSHAWMADRLGDPTARLAGRLSFNPLVHYDPIGSTLLIITVILTSLGTLPFPFGWAKPVPIDPYNLKNPKKDSALISLAGPFSNILLASVLSLVARVFAGGIIFNLLYPVILLNIALAVFNLIPIHPLDGGKILVGLLPDPEARKVDLFLGRYGTLLLFFVIFPTFGGVSLVSIIIDPIMSFLIHLLLPGAAFI
ncbi:MAG TPA: site-2 protease family protein [Patescibacteria group bacterium]|nr:site-2 protease family protein [Patescibacteria group bacterium]